MEQMADLKRYLQISVGLSVLVLVACKERTGPPVINFTTGDTVVNANDSAIYECEAWDWGLGPVYFHWSCSKGNLAWDSFSLVKWFAPESSGPAVIWVNVTDEDGNSTADSVNLRVAQVKTVLINYSGAVKPGLFRFWQDSLRLGRTVRGSFSVDTNLVSFLILNDTNYRRWVNNQSYEYLVARLFAEEDSFAAAVPNSGIYYFVLDNSYGKMEKVFNLFVEEVTP